MPFWRKGKKINRTFKKLFPLFSLSCHRNAECSEGSIPEKDSNYAKARCKHWKRRSKSPSWPQAERWTHQQQNVILKKSSPLLRNWLKQHFSGSRIRILAENRPWSSPNSAVTHLLLQKLLSSLVTTFWSFCCLVKVSIHRHVNFDLSEGRNCVVFLLGLRVSEKP